MKSMTGFGRGEYCDNNYRFVVEVKSVNHRYHEVFVRMPRTLNFLEEKLRKSVAADITRGRIDVFVTWDDYNVANKKVFINKELAVLYFQQLQDLARTVGLNSTINVNQLAQYPDVMKTEEKNVDADFMWQCLQEALQIALNNISDMRRVEGMRLCGDLLERLEHLRHHMYTLKERAPKINEEYRLRLYQKMNDALDGLNIQIDEGRILQEVAIFSEKVDFSEELVRLSSHLSNLGDNFKNDNAVGKKLDFIMQEINREINTIGSKANDIEVGRIIVDMKSEAEKIREQIQNLE